MLGGRSAARFVKRLSMPVSADTLLRILRWHATPSPTCAKIVGIDDFAWRWGQRYGTILCDLQTGGSSIFCRTGNPPLSPTGSQHVPASRSCVAIAVAAIAREPPKCPQALQVADQWHLLENASAAFLGADKQRSFTIGDALPTVLNIRSTLASADHMRDNCHSRSPSRAAYHAHRGSTCVCQSE
jgi:hypothetical protein